MDHTMFKKSGWSVCDLCQLVRTGRGRAECADGALMTLTTNCSQLYVKDHRVSF